MPLRCCRPKVHIKDDIISVTCQATALSQGSGGSSVHPISQAIKAREMKHVAKRNDAHLYDAFGVYVVCVYRLCAAERQLPGTETIPVRLKLIDAKPYDAFGVYMFCVGFHYDAYLPRGNLGETAWYAWVQVTKDRS